MAVTLSKGAGLIFCLSLWIRPGVGTAQTPEGTTADDTMRRALANALQADGRSAVAALRGIDTAQLSARYAPTRSCMLQRLDTRAPPAPAVSDPTVMGVLAAYREYWLRSLRAEHPAAANEAWLLDTLNVLVDRGGEAKAASLDDLEPAIGRLIERGSYHLLLGVTSPLRELMLWKTETETRYDVKLPESTQPVRVVFMDDFASLGWAGFATCDRHHTGGWTKPDRLYAVRSAYDVASENFRVSYLAHEAQHFSDNQKFPKLDRQDRLEYRAKLVELAEADSTAYELLENFASNVGTDLSVPHSYANGRVVSDMGRRLFPGTAGAPVWTRASVQQVNSAAVEILRQDTRQLAREPAPAR